MLQTTFVLRFAAFVCLLVSGAPAATIQFHTLPGNTEFGTSNGFLPAVVDGDSSHLLICDDYYHTTYVPSGPMIFTLSTLTGSDPLQYARFIDPAEWEASLNRYRMAAFLLDGLSRTGPGILLDLTADYQYALWHLFTPGAPVVRNAGLLLNDAAASVAAGGLSNDILYSRLRIYTPAAGYASNQEFLELLPPIDPHPWESEGSGAQATPEPSPAALLSVGTGLIALGCILRRATRGRSSPREIPGPQTA